MTHYVCVGLGGAVAVHRGFACTPDELSGELRRVAEPAVGRLVKVEFYSTREAADAVAADYNERLRASRLEFTDRGSIHRGPLQSY